MKTRISDILGIRYPIIQGGMAWVATAELASAVSNAGGLGIIAAGNAPPEWVNEQINKVRKMTDKTFGVNVMLLSPYVDEVMNVIHKQKVPVITTGAGNPAKYIEALKLNATKVIPVVPSVALAKRMEKEGADAIIAEGTEAGGHVGELTTMALIPQVVDAVTIPVIAAGGIGDARGLIAAFALGAEGVQMGTRFICSKECLAHDNYKEMIIRAKDRDAVVTARTTGHPVRSLKNKLTRDFNKLEAKGASLEQLDELGQGSLQAAVCKGDTGNGSVMAGQISGLINNIETCENIINNIIKDTCNIIDKVKLYCGEDIK